MHCTSCGNTLPPNATICPTCGVPVAFPQGAATGGNAYAPPPPPYQGGYGAVPANVPNYLVQSILVTLCCCLPFGIVAIVFAAQVNSKLAAGDVAGAMDASAKARMWCWIAFGVGILCSIGWFMANSAAFMRGFHQGLGR